MLHLPVLLREVVRMLGVVVMVQWQLAIGVLLAGVAAVKDVADGADAVLRRADLAHAVLVLHEVGPLDPLLVVPRPVVLGRRLSDLHHFLVFLLFLHLLSIPLQPKNKNRTPSISLSI